MPVTPPIQERSVDPYSNNRFSSVINRLTRVVTGGKHLIIFPSTSFLISKSSTPETSVLISSGVAVKDDVLIHVTEEDFELKFDVNENYIDNVGGMTIEGLYYIVIDYVYTRTYPHPKAYYKIIKDKKLFDAKKYIFVGGVYVISSNDILIIDQTKEFIYIDPQKPSVRREGENVSLDCIDGGILPDFL